LEEIGRFREKVGAAADGEGLCEEAPRERGQPLVEAEGGLDGGRGGGSTRKKTMEGGRI
jgi:hypothetical protein